MPKRKRVRRDWPAILQAHARSGLSVSAFCQQQGISSSLLYRWRRRYPGEPVPVAAGSFVELRPVGSDVSGSGVTVLTDTGWRLEVQPGFDAATLERVLICTRRSLACSP